MSAANTIEADDEETQPLQKSAPLRIVTPKPNAGPFTLRGVLEKIVGPAAAPMYRVSESLDYEPVQNRVFYNRLKIRKEGKKLPLWGYTGHTLAKFLVTFLTGIITGIIAFFMAKWNNSIIIAKLDFVQESIDAHANTGLLTGFLWFWFIGACMVSVGTAMVQYWAPASAGAGVTLVMAYLNGNHIPNLLRLSTLITKFVGTVCAVSGGLPMGPEGPMVHLGACVASVITYVECGCLSDSRWGSCWGRHIKNADIKERLKVLDEIVSDSDHREFVSAGVSAGISAAFGAPIGGVLFSMEEACSFWSRKTAWRCFIAAILSTFAIQLLNKSAAQHGMIGFANLHAMDNIEWLQQLPFIIINSAVAGILGAVFNSVRMWLWRVRAAKTRHLLRIAEVIGLVFLVALCGFFWGWAAGSCLPTPADWGEEGYGLRLRCPEGQHNDLATLFLSSSHHTIIKLFSIGHNVDAICDPGGGSLRRRLHAWPSAAFMGATRHSGSSSSFAATAASMAGSWSGDGGGMPEFGMSRALLNGTSVGQLQESPYTKGSLAIFVFFYLMLMSIGAGLAIPGGLFMPAILLGASWGALWGLLIRDLLPSWNVQPGVYALMAATGVLGGVFRSAISLVVLVVEGTRGIDFLFGVIAAVVIANWVAQMIHHDGVYESELERIGNVYMLRDEAPHRLQTLTVETIMATGVYGFRPIENVGRILEVLRMTTHNGFPVWLDPNESMAASDTLDEIDDIESIRNVPPPLHIPSQDPESPVLILEGIILRNQLLVLLQRRHFCDATGRPVGREPDDKVELELENEMKTFFRRYYTHNRWVSATAEPLDALQLDTAQAHGNLPVNLASLFLDLRPFMNRSPFVVRKDCSASRAHQVFVSLGLRHLIAVDAHNRVVGIITRKDLDHAAGHGWWRLSHTQEPPKNNLFRKMQATAIGQRMVNSISFLRGMFLGVQPSTPQGDHSSSETWPPVAHSSAAGNGNGTPHGGGATATVIASSMAANNNSNVHNDGSANSRSATQVPLKGFNVRFADESSLLTPPSQSEGARLYEERQQRSAAAAQHQQQQQQDPFDGMLGSNVSLRD